MSRTISCAIFALLVSSGAVFSQTHFVARSFHRPPVRVVLVHYWHSPLFFRSTCFVPYLYPAPYAVSYPVGVTDYVSSPSYVFVGSDSPAHPQLVFKDGTIYTVADYWRVDDQLHFITVEDGGTKSVPHSVPFSDLDEQRTKDAATAQGFNFVIRDRPIQEWLAHRTEQHALQHSGKAGKS
jgi:hypothetical protein